MIRLLFLMLLLNCPLYAGTKIKAEQAGVKSVEDTIIISLKSDIKSKTSAGATKCTESHKRGFHFEDFCVGVWASGIIFTLLFCVANGICNTILNNWFIKQTLRPFKLVCWYVEHRMKKWNDRVEKIVKESEE